MKCKCKLDIVVIERAEGCPVHKEVSGLQLDHLTRLQQKLERAKRAYDPRHTTGCDCFGCRRFKRAFYAE